MIPQNIKNVFLSYIFRRLKFLVKDINCQLIHDALPSGVFWHLDNTILCFMGEVCKFKKNMCTVFYQTSELWLLL